MSAEGEGDVSERVDMSVEIWRVFVDEQPQNLLAIVVGVNLPMRMFVVLRHESVSMYLEESIQ